MRTIIAGPRDCEDYELLCVAVQLSEFDISEVVSGHARGVDSMGERWAREHGVPIKVFPAEWNKYGNTAGPKRNLQMAEYAEGAILLWDGLSRGTRSMRDISVAKGLKVFVYGIRGYRSK